jgi:uncharacterized protein YdeI (YjbR/CyaY-like superfamily)
VNKDTESDFPVISFATRKEWEAWLDSDSDRSKGVWVKLAKKASGIASVSQKEAIEVALCYGWIDGQLNKFDQSFWLIRFTPRKPGSRWSELNRTKALDLIEQRKMKPAGLKEIFSARADGRWDAAYAPQSKASVPDDLQLALDANEKAKRLFRELDSTNRYAILHRIHHAKKLDTRARRIEQYVSMLSRGETIYPRKGKR